MFIINTIYNMININKSGDSLLITSYNNSQFPWSDGELSVPLNSVYFILEKDTDFLVFRSIHTDEKLFTALIDEIQINGQQATRDNIVQLFDSVANTIVSGDGTIIAGVESLNGLSGALNIKSINGQSLLGTGDITIEGGGVESLNGKTGALKLRGLGSEENGYFSLIGEGNLALEFDFMPTDDWSYYRGLHYSILGQESIMYFKTINNQPITCGWDGENITIEGADMSNYYDKTESDTRFAPKADVDYLNQWQGQYASDVESISQISSKLDEVEQQSNDNNSDIESLQSEISNLSDSVKDVVVNDANDGTIEVTYANNNTETYYSAKINGKPVLSQSANESYEIPDTSNYYTKSEIDTKITRLYNDLNKEEWIGTQAEFDALDELNSDVNYYIIEE